MRKLIAVAAAFALLGATSLTPVFAQDKPAAQSTDKSMAKPMAKKPMKKSAMKHKASKKHKASMKHKASTKHKASMKHKSTKKPMKKDDKMMDKKS